MTTRPSRRRSGAVAGATALTLLLSVVLAACGGGGGGDGDRVGVTLNILVVNRQRDAQANASLSDGRTGDEPVEACKSRNYQFTEVVEPFQVLVNDEVVIDSAELESNLIGRNLAAFINVQQDGTVELNEVRAGRPFTGPPALGICV